MALVALAGCATPRGAAGEAEVERLVRALGRSARLGYERVLAAEGVAGSAAPPEAEVLEARDDLDAALRAATGTGLGGGAGGAGTGGAGPAAAAARDVLLTAGYVLLPTPPGDPGVAVARVVSRERGLALAAWGRTRRYRRVVHEALAVPDLETFRALRAGGPLVPLGRHAGSTVYVDRDAVARRAGRGAAAHLTPDALAAQVELRQAAYLLFSGDVAVDDLVGDAARARALEGLHARVLLTALRYGDAALGREEVRALATGEARLTDPALARAARWIASLVDLDAVPPADLPAAAEAAFAALPGSGR